MNPSSPLRTSVIGSYPFPSWLELAAAQLERFGPDDLAEVQEDAVIAAVHDQLAAGLDVITDGEQTRLDFNLSFYGFIHGIALESQPLRRFGPPAHDQRGRHPITAPLTAPRGLGVVDEYRRLHRVAESLRVGNALFPMPTSAIPTAGPSPRRSCRWFAPNWRPWRMRAAGKSASMNRA